MKHFYFNFPIQEFTTSTQKAVEEINRLAKDSRKSFSLLFDPIEPKRIRVQSCKGVISKASFYLTERTPQIEERVAKFNSLLAKNPTVLAVGVEEFISITVVA